MIPSVHIKKEKIYIQNTVRYVPTYHPSFAHSRNTTYSYNPINHSMLMMDWASATIKTQSLVQFFAIALAQSIINLV